jgi:cytoskeletal protein RodZ
MTLIENQKKKTKTGFIVLLIGMLGTLMWSGCQARKEAQIDTTVPKEKGSYVPQKGGGDGVNSNPATGNQPKVDPTSLASPYDKGQETKILGGWAGTADQPNGWKLVDLEPTQSAPPNGGGTQPPASTTNPAPGSGPSTGPTAATGSVTYAGQIKSLLDKYCVTCHKAGGARSNSPLDTYPSTTLAQDSVQKIAAGSMPKAGSPQLTPQEKELFQKWQAGQFAR